MVLAEEGLLRMHGAGVKLAESKFSPGNKGTFTSYMIRFV